MTDFARRYAKTFSLLRRRARQFPWQGRTEISDALKAEVESPEEPGKRISILLTFDVGHHASGWWRNSGYDQCWHVSLCVVKETLLEIPGETVRGPDGRIAAFETPTQGDLRTIAEAIFGADVRKAWIEPPAGSFDPYRNKPQSRHAYHVRVFVDRRTGASIVPQGEVYDLKPWSEGDSPEKVHR
jgi:hypothetical protein